MSIIIENEIIFDDRKDAGEQLARFLEAGLRGKDPIIFGVPRGGVEVAYYVAKRLGTELCVLVAKKLSYPWYDEFGFGAIAEEDAIFIPEQALQPSEELIAIAVEKQRAEIRRRVEMYRHGRPLPDMRDRTVVLVDDGIATGVTLVPAIRLCRQKGAAKIIIAAPVSGPTHDVHLNEADAFKVISQPDPFFAVSQAYKHFPQLADEDVLKFLERSAAERPLQNRAS